ncbi:Cysteine desulfurase [compost metagenome]
MYVGARARALMRAQIHGGGHERGLRSGTLPTHQIVGMGSAFALAGQPGDSEHQRIGHLARRLRDGLLALPGVSLNGCASQRIAHTLNLCIEAPGFNSMALASELALSTTSACNSASHAPSHVLLALGLDEAQARKSVRLSVGRFTSEAEVDKAIEVFERTVAGASLALW